MASALLLGQPPGLVIPPGHLGETPRARKRAFHQSVRCAKSFSARRGDADLVLVPDPEAEQKFISEGYGIDRRQIAWNDFVIVGPDNDPARLKGGHDAVAAFKAIAPIAIGNLRAIGQF